MRNSQLQLPQMSSKRKASLGFIFITVLVDIIGIGVIIPVIPELIVKLDGGTFSSAAKTGGWLIGIFALMQFLFAPLLGALSDRYGRRPVLLIALFGLSIDYFIHGIAPNITWLMVSRMLAGMMGASYTVATAYVSDVSDPQTKARNFGLIGAAFGLGFIIGPFIGGVFGSIRLELPFYISAGLTFLNFLYGLFVLPESLPEEERRAFNWKDAIPGLSLLFILKKKEVLAMVGSFFLVYIASHALQSTWSFYTALRYNWEEKQIGYSLMAIGAMVAVVQAFLVGAITKKLGTKKTMITGFTMWFIGMALFGLSSNAMYLYLSMIPYMLGGIASPTVQSVISNQVKRSEQGALQGALTGLISISAIIGPLVMTNVFSNFTDDTGDYIPGAPFFLGAILIGTAALIMYFSLRKLKDEDLNRVQEAPAIIDDNEESKTEDLIPEG